MKRLLACLLILCLSLPLAACGEPAPTYYAALCECRIDRIEYITADGTWTADTVDDMIDFYYNAKNRSVQVTVEATFTVDEDFQYATLLCTGGIEELGFGGSVMAQRFTETLGEHDRDKGAIRAGTYKITLDSVDFKFYEVDFSAWSIEIPIERAEVTLRSSISVYKYEQKT